MTVLVVFASKYGSTEEIARAVAEELVGAGLEAKAVEAADEPADLEELMSETGARAHMVFAGKLDRERLNVGERLLVRALKAPEGDFRDWDAIREWARGIAAELAQA